MLITRKSPFTSIVHSMEINVTEEQLRNWKAGVVIQKAMPNVSPDEREFIMTGITPQEWEDTFGSE